MRTNPPEPWPLLLAAWIAAAAFGGVFLYLASQHVRYPGFVEVTEGDALQEIERIANGRVPYPAPGGEFVALTYTPLYFALAVPFYRAFGDSFAGPRLLSCLAAVAAGVLLAWIAWRESRSGLATALAAGLYFAGYALMDAYLTCALPDAVFLLFLLLGYCFLAYGTRRSHDLGWLFCFALAFWTKQHGALFFGFAVLYALFFRVNALPRWLIIAVFLMLGPLAYVVVGSHLGEAFFYHTFIVPGRWEHRAIYSIRRTVFVFFALVPFSVLLTLRSFRELGVWREALRGRIAPLPWFTVTTLLATAATMTAAGSSNNHYIPLIAILAPTAALGARALVGQSRIEGLAAEVGLMTAGAVVVAALATIFFKNHDISMVPPVSLALASAGCALLGRTASPGSAVALLLVSGQFAVSTYDPTAFLPASGFRDGLARLRREIGSLEGRVYWLPHGYAPTALTGTKVGRAPSWVVLDDIDRQQGAPGEAARVLAPFRHAILSGAPSYILIDGDLSEVPYWRLLAGRFALARDLGAELSTVRQIGVHWYSGPSFPRYLYRRIASGENEPDPAVEKR